MHLNHLSVHLGVSFREPGELLTRGRRPSPLALEDLEGDRAPKNDQILIASVRIMGQGKQDQRQNSQKVCVHFNNTITSTSNKSSFSKNMHYFYRYLQTNSRKK